MINWAGWIVVLTFLGFILTATGWWVRRWQERRRRRRIIEQHILRELE